MSESASASAGKYADYSREQLIAEINRLKKTKKYGLVWEHKTEQVIEDFKNGKQPYLKEVTDKRIENAPNEPTNLIIEGDNFDALSILNYTHAGKVDVIYIDPPYNTGNKDFIYNDDYVDSEDEFRHSKWLSFMEPRLKLAKNLLKEDGVIFISIDDNEQAALKMLCDSVFLNEKMIAEFVIDKTAQGANQSSSFKTQHEYLLAYCNGFESVNTNVTDEIDNKKYKYSDEKGRYALTNGFDSINSPLSANKNRGYTVYYNEQTGNAIVRDEFDREKMTFGDYDTSLLEDGYIPIRPGIRKGIQYPWNWMSSRFEREYKEELVFCRNKKGSMSIMHKNRASGLVKDTTLKRFDTRKYGNQALSDILGEKVFDYPKSIDMMKWVITRHMNKNTVILDFFAGSGTTGQAVLELNKEDGGHRQFILCTNNGDKGPDSTKIAEDITYPRIKTVITGKRQDGSKYSDGIPANLRYYKIGHLEKRQSVDAYRQMLVDKMENILQVKENVFEEIETKADYAFYQNSDKILGLVYESFELDKVIERLEKINENKKDTILYVFSYSRDALSEDYNLGFKVEFKAMPEGLLKTYLNILEELRKEDE